MRRANGILLARENGSIASRNLRTRVTNNIVDSVGIGIGYGSFGTGGISPTDDATNDGFADLWIAQNTIRWSDLASRDNETTFGGIDIGVPDAAASGTNHVRNNIIQEQIVSRALNFPASGTARCPSPGCQWLVRNNFFSVKPVTVDASNLQGDPSIVGPFTPLDRTDEGRYRLNAGSLAISKGAQVLSGPGPNDSTSKLDYFSTTRCASAPSIGIHEAQPACACGLTYCSGVCASLQTDDKNCGQCGRICPASAPTCNNGECEPLPEGGACPAGMQSCCGDCYARCPRYCP